VKTLRAIAAWLKRAFEPFESATFSRTREAHKECLRMLALRGDEKAAAALLELYGEYPWPPYVRGRA